MFNEDYKGEQKMTLPAYMNEKVPRELEKYRDRDPYREMMFMERYFIHPKSLRRWLEVKKIMLTS